MWTWYTIFRISYQVIACRDGRTERHTAIRNSTRLVILIIYIHKTLYLFRLVLCVRHNRWVNKIIIFCCNCWESIRIAKLCCVQWEKPPQKLLDERNQNVCIIEIRNSLDMGSSFRWFLKLNNQEIAQNFLKIKFFKGEIKILKSNVCKNKICMF